MAFHSFKVALEGSFIIQNWIPARCGAGGFIIYYYSFPKTVGITSTTWPTASPIEKLFGQPIPRLQEDSVTNKARTAMAGISFFSILNFIT
ncbi:MAG: hypothetical protein ACI8YQ_003786 [Polaribacter sp.]|jgi:hypothetical protein